MRDQHPHVVITDIRMPPTGTNEGIQAATWLREHGSILAKLGLSEEKDVNRRVKAVLLFLSASGGG